MNLPILMCLLAAGAVAAGKIEHDKHVKRVWKFGCGVPQMRSIPVSSLKTRSSGEKYTPAMTVLHRCDCHTGVCTQGEGYGCGPAATEEVALLFHVKWVDESGLRRGKPRERYETVKATNHTLCECQYLLDLPK